MPKKRGHNEGSIRKRKDGTWEARYSVGVDLKGKQVQRSVYGKTRSEVSIKLTQALEQINTGKYIDQAQIQLSAFLDEWLLTKRNKLKPTTYDSYEQHIRVHIKPIIGWIKLKDLKPKQIQEFYDLKFEKGKAYNSGGLSNASIVKIHTVLHSALEYAVNNRMITNNPSSDISIPRGTQKERRVLTLEEQKAFLSVLDGDRLKVAFILSISTGMRLGEILALTWDDVNLDEKYLIVRRTLANIKKQGSEGKRYSLVPQEPKTDKSKRLIPIPDTIIPLLLERKTQQQKDKFLLGEIYQDNNLVFSTQVGTFINPRNFMRSFYRLIEKAGIPKANVHSLRHTFATRMLELGENPRVVQELLGHKNISQTLNTYTHVLEETKKSAISKIDTLLVSLNTTKTT